MIDDMPSQGWQQQLAAECPPEEYAALLLRLEMAKSDKQRSAALAARKREAGLIKVCVWVPEEKADSVRALARKLSNQPPIDR